MLYEFAVERFLFFARCELQEANGAWLKGLIYHMYVAICSGILANMDRTQRLHSAVLNEGCIVSGWTTDICCISC